MPATAAGQTAAIGARVPGTSVVQHLPRPDPSRRHGSGCCPRQAWPIRDAGVLLRDVVQRGTSGKGRKKKVSGTIWPRPRRPRFRFRFPPTQLQSIEASQVQSSEFRSKSKSEPGSDRPVVRREGRHRHTPHAHTHHDQRSGRAESQIRREGGRARHCEQPEIAGSNLSSSQPPPFSLFPWLANGPRTSAHWSARLPDRSQSRTDGGGGSGPRLD